ncbi:MAG: hypothetical protein ACK506_16275 [Pirellula sp.]
MKCRVDENGVLVPRCMGTAAAMGCGKTDAQILSHCTCRRVPYSDSDEHLRISKLIDRVVRLEKEVAELKSAAQKKDEGWIVK